jgi:hypothetical protein
MPHTLEFDAAQLLATHDFEEPLIADGVRCHGGFLADGTYVSPRTKFRAPALAAWQEQHRQTFGTEILNAPVDTWPGNYPNIDQARFLLRNGIREPIIATLTRIGTVEGFGAMIRFLAPSDMQRFFDDDITGTATAHLGNGLVEAHARDEAGWEDEAGHDRMWYAVRDIAFENPVTQNETQEMLKRMGIPVGAGADPAAAQQRFLDRRMFTDLDLGLEMLISTMLRVLFVEIKAFHIFAWAEELLSDTSLVAGDGAAAKLVSYIRADETPHVEYLRTALTEMRDRTFVGESGTRYPGTEIIGRMWDASLEESLGLLEEQNRAATVAEIERALASRARGRDLLAEFHHLADPEPSVTGR